MVVGKKKEILELRRGGQKVESRLYPGASANMVKKELRSQYTP